MKTLVLNFVNRLSLLRYALVLFLAVGFISCDKEDDIIPIQDDITAMKDIPSFLESFSSTINEDEYKAAGRRIPSFRTLMTALTQSGLIDDVAKNRLTLFAPTDEAFEALGLNSSNIGSVPNLETILLYHAVAGTNYSYQLSDGFVPTLNGAAVKIMVEEGGVMVNDAQVVYADKKALNGVVHIIDKVMLPPTQNLVEVALGADPEFSILVAAVVKAGLAETLATGGPFTIFAPTNDAFVALLGELGFPSLDAIPVDVLTNVLLYHVVSGRVYSSDLVSGPVTTLNGSFSVDTSTLEITDANGRTSNLVPAMLDIQATNGVIHVIDRVILPTL